MTSITEENYLKAIYKLGNKDKNAISTSAIANLCGTSAASVTDMLKKLADKEYIIYQKYHGVSLTSTGYRIATSLIRKHRMWEVFLVDKLRFRWDEVHDLAEELEHIKSDDLINRLDNFLGNPKFDPHGDPIPNKEGRFTIRNQRSLDQLLIGDSGILIGVKEHDRPFLEFLNNLEVSLGTQLSVVERLDYDNSLKVIINGNKEALLPHKVSSNLLVKDII